MQKAAVLRTLRSMAAARGERRRGELAGMGMGGGEETREGEQGHASLSAVVGRCLDVE